MNNIQKASVLYILLVVVAVYSYAVGRFQVFPYSLIEPLVQDFQAFAQGDPTEETSTVEKLKHDFGLSFDRLLYSYPEIAVRNSKLREFPSLEKRPEQPLIYVHPEHRKGYRVIIGALDLNNTFWGGLLIGPDGEILHTWDLSTVSLPTNEAKPRQKNLYGVHVFPDGSVIFSMHEAGGGIVKVDACSNIEWSLEGHYHHTISPDDQGYFWSFEGGQKAFDQDMVKVSVDTGEIVQRIRMQDVRKANPNIAIWNLQSNIFFKLISRKNIYEKGNMTHGNDIDPLPSRLAEDFPGFSPGDLLVSYATTNLIYVLDPETLQVKWWRVGASDAQHDPDWEPGGTFTMYSNNPRTKNVSDIVSIDPQTMDASVVVPGEKFNMRSKINSTHELSPYQTRMITSAQQGWAVEINEEQEIIFSFVNNVNQEKRKALHLSDAWHFDESYFDNNFWEVCDNRNTPI